MTPLPLITVMTPDKVPDGKDIVFALISFGLKDKIISMVQTVHCAAIHQDTLSLTL